MTTMLSAPSSLACQPRFSSPRSGRRTFGGNVAEVADALGTPLMPWQRHVVDVALEIDDDGRFVYDQVVLTVPRQSGKTTLLLALMTWRLIGTAERQHVTYAAQSGVAARDKLFDDYWPALSDSPLSRLFTARKTSGHEAIMSATGSRLTITAATEKAGHGGSLDCPVIDEAFAYTDARLEQALLPAMRARRRFLPGPQLWVVSTAGNAASTYLKGKVDAGRAAVEAGKTSGTAYFEWSADLDADPADPATWWSCIPSMGYTVDEAAIRAEFETYVDENEWRRAGLNQWQRSMADPVVDPGVWYSLSDPESQITGTPTFSYDVAPDRATAAISVSGRREDGLSHIEVVAHNSGTGWVVDRLEELTQRHGGDVVIDPSAPGGSLLPEIERRGIPHRLMRTRDVVAGCGQFYDGSMNDAIRHLGQQSLNDALSGARKRELNGGGWAWSRTSVEVDITPLVAATNALWGAGTTEPEPEIFAY